MGVSVLLVRRLVVVRRDSIKLGLVILRLFSILQNELGLGL